VHHAVLLIVIIGLYNPRGQARFGLGLENFKGLNLGLDCVDHVLDLAA